MTLQAVHAKQKTITARGCCRIDPERRVLTMSDKPQLRISQRIGIKGLHRHTPHSGDLRPVREHGAPSHAR